MSASSLHRESTDSLICVATCVIAVIVAVCVQVHALVTSEQRVMTEVLQQEDDGSTTTVSLERDPLFVAPVVDHFRLQLFSPASWEVVPNTE